jgi:hypothetical protein
LVWVKYVTEEASKQETEEHVSHIVVLFYFLYTKAGGGDLNRLGMD